jgi:hypothetical protein
MLNIRDEGRDLTAFLMGLEKDPVEPGKTIVYSKKTHFQLSDAAGVTR